MKASEIRAIFKQCLSTYFWVGPICNHFFFSLSDTLLSDETEGFCSGKEWVKLPIVGAVKSEKWLERDKEGEISGDQSKRGRPGALPFTLLLLSDSPVVQAFFSSLLSLSCWSGSHLSLVPVLAELLWACKQPGSWFWDYVWARVIICVIFVWLFWVFLPGDSFYSYTTPDWVLSLLVLKLSSKRFPLPVQRWISLQECTSTDSHFLLDMTELPLLRQLI